MLTFSWHYSSSKVNRHNVIAQTSFIRPQDEPQVTRLDDISLRYSSIGVIPHAVAGL